MDISQIENQLSEEIRIVQRPDGEFMLETGFRFPDGDTYPIYISETWSGFRLSDKGDTFMRISVHHPIDTFLAGQTGELVQRILIEEGVSQTSMIYIETDLEDISDALFRYGQAVTRIYNLSELLPYLPKLR